MDRLESIQERYVRLMLEVPVSTPKIALRAETGLLSMKHRIWGEKVNVFSSQKRSQDGLAKQVYQEQLEQDWLDLPKKCRRFASRLVFQMSTKTTQQRTH